MLIIYYKQISEGYEDKKRFEIMQKVGMSRREVKRSIRAQVLMVFFLPLVTSFVHIAHDLHSRLYKRAVVRLLHRGNGFRIRNTLCRRVCADRKDLL